MVFCIEKRLILNKNNAAIFELFLKLDPDNKTLPVNLHKHDSGLYRVTYRPSIVGVHMVTIMHRNQPITKHPWKVQVIDSELVIVSGLNEAICNKPTSFKGFKKKYIKKTFG